MYKINEYFCHVVDLDPPTQNYEDGLFYSIGKFWIHVSDYQVHCCLVSLISAFLSNLSNLMDEFEILVEGNIESAVERVMKKFLFPTAVIAAAPAVAPSKDGDTCEECKEHSKLIKPSELPIYEQPRVVCKPSEPETKRSELEEAISVVRKELWIYVDDFHRYKEKMVEYVETGKAHTEFIFDFLKEEQNYLPRAGAIGLGGLTGLVLGLRGGFFRRLLYGTIGAGGMASLCYPREAAQYSTEAYQAAKKYAVIGYNFAAGDDYSDGKVVEPSIAIKPSKSSLHEPLLPTPKPLINEEPVENLPLISLPPKKLIHEPHSPGTTSSTSLSANEETNRHK